jgi:hypothetical protein
MSNNAKEFGVWFLKCVAIGSVPGVICWTVWTMLGGFAI